jgi:hypothetical protein
VFQITLRKTIPFQNDSQKNNHHQKPSPPPSRSHFYTKSSNLNVASSPRKAEMVQEKEKDKNDLERDMQKHDPSQSKTRLSRLFLVDLA